MSTSPPLLHDGGLVAEHHDGVQQEHVVRLLPGRSQHLQVARPPQPPEVLQPRALGEINGLDTSLNIFQDGKVLFILKIIYFRISSYTSYITKTAKHANLEYLFFIFFLFSLRFINLGIEILHLIVGNFNVLMFLVCLRGVFEDLREHDVIL